jgi:hypothetical protein
MYHAQPEQQHPAQFNTMTANVQNAGMKRTVSSMASFQPSTRPFKMYCQRLPYEAAAPYSAM